MRLIVSMSCLLFACGGEDTAISFLPLEYDPGCYVDQKPEPPSDLTDAERLNYTAQRQMLEFQVAFSLQAAKLFSNVVEEDPYASKWRVDRGHGIAEGEVLARGEGWSVLEMIIRTGQEWEGEPVVYRARINTLPNRTTYDFGGSVLDVRPDLFALDDYVRGCNPDNGWSFEVAPVVTENGVEKQTRCWPMPYVSEEASEEFAASFQLQCVPMIEKMRLP